MVQPYKLLYPSYSADHQDHFVQYVTRGMRNGFFLDLGCNDPITKNNTFSLETFFSWRGFLIDADPKHIEICTFARKSRARLLDLNQRPLSQSILPACHPIIDYVSFDLDDSTLAALLDWPFKTHQMRCLTFEHDRYRVGPGPADSSRAILIKHGYIPVCADVHTGAGPFEDWWINPKLLPEENYCALLSTDMTHDDIFARLSA